MMTRIQKVKNLTDLPKPCDYFHLMAGKSTGGFIVILLSRLKMTTKEAIDLYYELSSRIFSRKNKRTWWGRLLGLHEFDPKALEEIIKELVDSRGIGGLMLDDDTSHLPKAFVCSQNAYDQGVPVRFRTYEPPSAREVIPGGLSRTHHISLPSSTPLLSSSSVGMSMIGIPEEGGVESTSPVPDDLWDEYRDIRIWEAARATTAAPSYFPPMSIVRGNETRTFIDGAMGCNNPSFELVHEAIALYGPRRVLGCLISLGTGSSGPLTIGTRKGLRGFRDLLTNIKRLATDSESVHRGLQSQMRPVLNTYFRFQLPNGTENIKLHHYEKLDELSKLTEAYIKNKSSEIDKVVSILVGNARPRGISLGQIGKFLKSHYLIANLLHLS
ncbi:acyl transferase/acyl hydrolase/lysophospholipase [Rostrohypoxylon terebratum]|nr:acyl transferase/acyl hydrolase/lysophospholipase [Rostrohypoxylon terebratum]